MWNQTMIGVRDVPASSRWYSAVLGGESAHGGDEYDQITVDGELVLQLHDFGADEAHEAMGDPSLPLGNGVALWFEVRDFAAAVDRSAAVGATVEKPPHDNPNARQQELWLTDPDGYRVLIAGQSAWRPRHDG